MLLNTMKDVAASLGDLIINSKKAHGKDVDHLAMLDMKTKAKVIHIEIRSFMKFPFLECCHKCHPYPKDCQNS